MNRREFLFSSGVLAAAAGLSYIAGFSWVLARLQQFDWVWVLPLIAGLLVSFVGYYYAYRGIFRVEGGPDLPRRQMIAVVAAAASPDVVAKVDLGTVGRELTLS